MNHFTETSEAYEEPEVVEEEMGRGHRHKCSTEKSNDNTDADDNRESCDDGDDEVEDDGDAEPSAVIPAGPAYRKSTRTERGK